MNKSSRLLNLIESHGYTLFIKLGGFKTPDVMAGLDARNAIEKELEKNGISVVGAGTGGDFMDIGFMSHVDPNPIVDKVMKMYGIRKEFYNIVVG